MLAEVKALCCRFIIAGHETTSTATTWCLFALTQAPGVQRKLREELLQVKTDMPTMDELTALPYLDMVVKETLRLHAPVIMTDRVAMSDMYVPLSKPYTDKQGKMHDGFRYLAVFYRLNMSCAESMARIKLQGFCGRPGSNSCFVGESVAGALG